MLINQIIIYICESRQHFLSDSILSHYLRFGLVLTRLKKNIGLYTFNRFAYMIQFSEAGISLKDLGKPVLLLRDIRVNEGPSCLEFKVQGPYSQSILSYR